MVFWSGKVPFYVVALLLQTHKPSALCWGSKCACDSGEAEGNPASHADSVTHSQSKLRPFLQVGCSSGGCQKLLDIPFIVCCYAKEYTIIK